ncbi:PAS domain-containing protein [Shewanella eurypsychrophilus]|uniref:histidine kinase n=2 Tax=Shewanellaceae TaxID=267890 RepID=A0ABX8S2S0_9GAMM|nr:PAS domain-containing protein [Shewanella sp. YLB-09]QXP44889.1 PAS domain-containing protein [Shewanella eurypsychrophilus]
MKSAVLLLSLLVSHWAIAIASPIHFDFYAEEQGLSMNTVTDIETDDEGYLWVATQNGLNRFDGKDFKLYPVTGDHLGPSQKHVNKLFYGRKKQLWLLTNNEGFDLYNPGTDTFTSFNATNSPLPSATYTDIAQDSQGTLWIATDSMGLIHYSPTKNKIIKHYRKAKDHLKSDHISQLYIDRFDRLWIIANDGLSQINNKHEITHYPEITSQIKDNITSIESGHSNTLWIGTKNSGLFIFDIYTNAIKHITSAIGLSGKKINHLKLGRFGKLWLGVEAVGLARYSPKNETIQFFTSDPSNLSSLNSPNVTALSLDNENQLWIGTQGGGLNKTYLEAEIFGHVHPFSFDDNNLQNSNIRSIYRDKSKQLWVGTSLGLYRAMENVHHDIMGFKPFEVPGSKLSQSFISFIQEDKQQRLWVGTRGEGLFIFTPDKRSYIQYKHDPSNLNGLPSDLLLSVYFDHQDNAWLATRNAGVAKYIDEEHGFIQFKHDRENPNSLASNEITSVIQDKDNNYWFASYSNGLTQLSPNGQFTRYSTDTEISIPQKHLTSLFQGEEDLLWVSSSEGVFSFDRVTHETKVFNTDNGLIGNMAYLSMLDNQHRLWVGTSSGLSLLNTRTANIKNFTNIDGLQDNEFNYGAGFIDSDNRIYLGGINGFNYFFASQLPKLSAPRMPVIHGLSVRNTTKNAQLQRSSIQHISQLTLSYLEDTFSFHYHTPELHRASRLSYQYKMVGLHDQWLPANIDQSVHFTGLAAGAYIFLIKSEDINGHYSPVKHINITILPAPWRSWWAYSIYLVSILLLLLLVFYSRWKKFQLQARLLQDKQESEQRLQLSLWGSGDEFWDWNIEKKCIIRSNTFLMYPEVEKHLTETIKSCVHPDDQPLIKSKMDDCLKDNQDKFELTYRSKMLDNTWLWVLNRGQVIERDSSGLALRIAGTIKNIQCQKEAEAKLIALNQHLENRVLDRTLQFQQSNDELKQALEQLEYTQSELVNKEKMATLGGLVASVTHEINTPIGISVTAASHLQESVKVFNKKYSQGDISHEDFEQYQGEVHDASTLILSNLARASKLIKSFKQVSVDQSHEEEHEFNLKLYLDEIFLALNPLLSRTKHQYSYQCPDNIIIFSSPGIFYQIISNLFNNSVVHAYPDGGAGKLTLNVVRSTTGLDIIYQDNGCGMPKEVQAQVFDPFFTTKRGKGGSGLGMNIVFNLVTQELSGDIRLDSEIGEGTRFTISLPESLLVNSD